MRALIEHLWRTNRAEIVAGSRRNCHVTGVHSVMLSHVPGRTIRFYLADWYHTLWQNTLVNGQRMSVAFHPHHCELTLHTVLGSFCNWSISEAMQDDRFRHSPQPAYQLSRYLFDSKLQGGKGDFTLEETSVGLEHYGDDKVKEGESLYLPAHRIHTVRVQKEERAAWLVYEGAGDPDYRPICYSNADLRGFNPEGLYQPTEEAEVRRWLRIAGLVK